MLHLQSSPLGKQTGYLSEYSPELLFSIPREDKRKNIGIQETPPFSGVDIWNSYEVSWLNPNGKPQGAIAEFYVPADTPYLFESKSLKLYLNSLNQMPFDSAKDVEATLKRDLSRASGGDVSVRFVCALPFAACIGKCLDGCNVEIQKYTISPEYLRVDEEVVEEELYSDRFKSNCLVTGQPDWASIQISYRGPRIHHAELLKYLISYRNHAGFHEDCAERIFMDLYRHCSTEKLAVYMRYTRRGGIDINPFRTIGYPLPKNRRTGMQ